MNQQDSEEREQHELYPGLAPSRDAGTAGTHIFISVLVGGRLRYLRHVRLRASRGRRRARLVLTAGHGSGYVAGFVQRHPSGL